MPNKKKVDKVNVGNNNNRLIQRRLSKSTEVQCLRGIKHDGSSPLMRHSAGNVIPFPLLSLQISNPCIAPENG